MPVLFLIHERKHVSTHGEMMQMVAKLVPYLQKGGKKVPFVTDDEKAITDSIDKHLQNVCRFYCWNHVLKAAKLWLRNHGASSEEIPVYSANHRQLFHQPSEQAYSESLNSLKPLWSQSFLSHYTDHIHPQVHACMNHEWMK